MGKIVKVKRTVHDAVLPKRASARAAGFDLTSPHTVVLEPNSTTLLSMGFSLQLPEDHVGVVCLRSGLNLKCNVSAALGVIDPDYRGDVGVVLHNRNTTPFTVERNDRVAQLLVLKLPKVQFEEAEELDSTERGTGGFGSTGFSAVDAVAETAVQADGVRTFIAPVKTKRIIREDDNTKSVEAALDAGFCAGFTAARPPSPDPYAKTPELSE